MTVWVLVVYMLNPPSGIVVPGRDPHVISEHEFRTRESCDDMKHQQERDDANDHLLADQFVYKCVERKAQ
jgi:hypothetical protein